MFDIEKLIQVLIDKKLTIGFAESCTGGLISSLVTQHSGVSKIFYGSVVSYSNDIKQKLLGVLPETLNAHGAVSQEVALEMAMGAKNLLGVDIALSVTGIAGPTGATKNKPVGLVYFAYVYQVRNSPFKLEQKSWSAHFSGNRKIIQEQSAFHGLSAVYKLLSPE